MENEIQKKDLKKKLISRFVPLIIILLLFLFFPAGSLCYWQAWVFIAVLLIPMTYTIFYFLKNDPDLLERRLRTRERVKEQKLIVKIGIILYPLFFIIPGFDYRLGWSNVPIYLVIAGDILVLTGYIFIILVFKANSYASRVIEVDRNQTVISTGPYAIVRHPMYAATIIMYTGLPFALGSYWTLAASVLLPAFLVARILNEEKVLLQNLMGYKEYCLKTKYRLIPYLW